MLVQPVMAIAVRQRLGPWSSSCASACFGLNERARCLSRHGSSCTIRCWHYDTQQALTVLARLGPLTDARLQEPLDMLKAKRLPSINARVTYLRWLFRPDQSSR